MQRATIIYRLLSIKLEVTLIELIQGGKLLNRMRSSKI